MLQVIKDNNLDSSEIKKLFKEMNSYGSIKHLDSLEDEAAKDATMEILEGIKEKELTEIK